MIGETAVMTSFQLYREIIYQNAMGMWEETGAAEGNTCGHAENLQIAHRNI